MKKFANIIYKYLFFYEPRLRFIEKSDVMQEIYIAILLAKKEEVFKVAHQLVENLLRQFGYSKKKGKDHFEIFYFQNTLSENQQELFNLVEYLYLTNDMTAKEIARYFNIEYSQNLQKLLHINFPKLKGWGGNRRKKIA